MLDIDYSWYPTAAVRTSIRQIQEAYFSMLETHFPDVESLLNQPGGNTLREIATDYVPLVRGRYTSPITTAGIYGEPLSGLAYRIRWLLADVRRFWQDNAAPLCALLQKSDGFNCILNSGEWGETAVRVPRLAMYFDTVCIGDPLLHLADQYHENPDSRLEAMAGPALMWFLLHRRRRSWFLTDSDYPLAIVYPGAFPGHLFPKDQLIRCVQDDALAFANDALGLALQTYEEAEECFDSMPFDQTLPTLLNGPSSRACEAILEGVRSRFPQLPLQQAFETLDRATTHDWGDSGVVPERRGIAAFFRHVYRHLWDVNTLALDGVTIKGEHSLQGDTWPTYKWRTARHLGLLTRFADITPDRVFTQATQAHSLQWMDSIQVEQLLRWRWDGEMEDLRSILRVGRRRLKTAPLGDIDALASALDREIDERVSEHKARLLATEAAGKAALGDAAKNTLKSTVAPTVGFAIASALWPASTTLGLIAGGYSVVIGGRSLLDLVRARKLTRKEVEDLQLRPIAILDRARRNSPDRTA